MVIMPRKINAVEGSRAGKRIFIALTQRSGHDAPVIEAQNGAEIAHMRRGADIFVPADMQYTFVIHPDNTIDEKPDSFTGTFCTQQTSRR